MDVYWHYTSSLGDKQFFSYTSLGFGLMNLIWDEKQYLTEK